MAKKFKVGQKVVCKDTDNYRFGTPRGIERGCVYTIKRILNCSGCGCEMLEFEETTERTKWCGFCDTKINNAAYHNIRFKKAKKNTLKKRRVLFLIAELPTEA